jgi:demethylmenaquinone methyltransferase / 2-methoxy-6-polyprenyl-1,4-benzoquinol methylase
MIGSNQHGAVDAKGKLMPHPVLSEYYTEEASRRAFLDQLFDRTSRDYDRIEWLIGFGRGPTYRYQALQRAGLLTGMRVVDVGIGTGLVARQAVKIVGDGALVIGVDPSAGMMSHARLPAGVKLLTGKGEAIPLPDGSADFLSMGFALRHLSSLDTAFAEFFRVVRPGGKICVLEVSRAPGPIANGLLKFYMKYLVPTMARLLTRDTETVRIWRYYWDTIEACVAPEVVMQALRDAGFVDVRRHVEVGIFSEYQATRP